MTGIMDGKALAESRQNKLAEKVARLKKERAIVPGLVVILVGDDSASQVYVRNKERSAKKAGFNSETVRLKQDISQEELLEVIAKYNDDDKFHGILVQLPLPKHINAENIIAAISPQKDVDGFHPINMGNLWLGRPQMIPCTPAGIMALLETYQVSLSGKHAVVVGRSNIVGKPMAQLLLDHNATVTIAHSRTQDLAAITKTADIVVMAVGQARLLTADAVKPGAIIIDVGMNRDQEGKLCGDVDYDAVFEVASLITPVPGGVGPMTITMLLEQTYTAACNHLS